MSKFLDVFKCKTCKKIPDSDVYICSKNDIYCLECATKRTFICECSRELKIKSNPLSTALQKVNLSCTFRGCTWKFSADDLEEHIKECKFRSYPCFGNILGLWRCQWTDTPDKLKEHFHHKHRHFSSIFSYSEQKTLPFNKTISIQQAQINIIEAFNKIFIFYYSVDAKYKFINIIIFLFGRKKSAGNYMYELEIFNPKNKCEMIKFSQSCYNHAAGIFELIKTGKCVNVAYHVLQNYVHENNIHYRFIMKRKVTPGTPVLPQNVLKKPTVN